MIFTDRKPTTADFSEKYAEYLMYDTVQNLKESFRLMGRRFIGQPRKIQVANGIARYVREHPLDVLHKCNAETLMYIKKMLEMGKGSCITIGQPIVRGRQIQQMNLVLTYDDMKEYVTEFYMLDELHDIFAPHIDEAYKNPSPTLQEDMLKGLEDMRKIAEGCKTEEDFLKKLKATIPEIDFDELFGENDDDEEEEKDDDNKIKEDSTGGGEPKMFTYSCSIPMMEDIRKLSYKSQAEVCKAFHKFIKKGFPGDDSYLIKRFEESYSEIIFSHLDDSLDQIHYSINDLDNAIHEIDMLDPMTFFDIEDKLAPIIKRGLEQK